MKELKIADVADFGNAEYFGTVDFAKGTVFAGDHCAEDYPQIIWKSEGKLKTGEKVVITYTYIPTPENSAIAQNNGLDAIDWNSKITKIELTEEDK